MKCPQKVRQGYVQDAGEYGPSGFMTSILSNRTFHPTNEDYVQVEEVRSDAEYAEALANLEKLDGGLHSDPLLSDRHSKKVKHRIQADRLTDFSEDVLRRCDFGHWLFRHYRDNRMIDGRFILRWEQTFELDD